MSNRPVPQAARPAAKAAAGLPARARPRRRCGAPPRPRPAEQDQRHVGAEQGGVGRRHAARALGERQRRVRHRRRPRVRAPRGRARGCGTRRRSAGRAPPGRGKGRATGSRPARAAAAGWRRAAAGGRAARGCGGVGMVAVAASQAWRSAGVGWAPGCSQRCASTWPSSRRSSSRSVSRAAAAKSPAAWWSKTRRSRLASDGDSTVGSPAAVPLPGARSGAAGSSPLPPGRIAAGRPLPPGRPGPAWPCSARPAPVPAGSRPRPARPGDHHPPRTAPLPIRTGRGAGRRVRRSDGGDHCHIAGPLPFGHRRRQPAGSNSRLIFVSVSDFPVI